MPTKSSLLVPYFMLLIFATTQLALVSRMVAFLHIQKTKVKTYQALGSDSIGFRIHVLPEKLSLNQGHTTNGAAGYGLVLSIALLAITFSFRNDRVRTNKTKLLIMTILLGLLVLFILSAFIYVFAVTYLTAGNRINTRYAQSIDGDPYPIDSWTPETWYKALLLLPLDNVDLTGAYQEMVAWRWWIFPYLIISILAFVWTALVWITEKATTQVKHGYMVYSNGEDGRQRKIGGSL